MATLPVKIAAYWSGSNGMRARLRGPLRDDNTTPCYTGYLLIEQAPPLNQDTLVADLTRARDMFRPYARGAAGSQAEK